MNNEINIRIRIPHPARFMLPVRWLIGISAVLMAGELFLWALLHVCAEQNALLWRLESIASLRVWP